MIIIDNDKRITNKKNNHMKENKKQLTDGVYIITENNQIIPFKFPIFFTENAAYIGLVQGNHSIAIALHDVSGDEITLTAKESKELRHYIDYMDAVQDWDGEGNTERLKQIGLNTDIHLKEGEYIPTLAELYLICLNQKAINEAIDFVGGQKLKVWYWSSTEQSTTYTWGLHLYTGTAYYYNKATYNGGVRLVKQFI